MTTCFATRRIHTRPGKINNASGDFVCGCCGAFVSVHVALSGVGNRNHCLYCLASRHMDQFSACKAHMRPIGLTFKRTTKKYTSHQPGELMLVHQCEDCGKVSINRIAADDDVEAILSVLEQSADLDRDTRALLEREGVMLLEADQHDLVRHCLLGIHFADAWQE